MKYRCLSLIIAIALLGACTAAPSTAPPPTLPVPTVQLSSSIAVTDALGRTVRFAAPPQRIVVAGKSTLPLLDAMYLFPQAKDRVVGWVTGRQKPEQFLGLLDPAAASKAALVVEAGPEQVSALKPDVVLLRSAMADKLGRGLEQLGIPVLYLDMETPEEHSRGIELLGQLFADPARAQDIQGYYQSCLDRVAQALEALKPEDRPRVLVLQYTAQGDSVALQVPPAAYIQTTLAELAGANPVWKDMATGGGWQLVNLEQIAAWNPDQIYIISYDTDPSQVVAKVKGEAQWQALQAVRNGRIYAFAGDIFSWDQPDPRYILGLMWLAQKVHPQRFAGWDMQGEIMQFFVELYGMDTAAVRESILPRLRGDVR